MKHLIKYFKLLCDKILNLLPTIIISSVYPIIEVTSNICINISKAMGINYKQFNTLLNILKKDIKRTISISFTIYYLALCSFEIYMFITILYGKIKYYGFSTLSLYTILVIIFSFIFVMFLNKNYKSNKFNYLIYFQLLFLLPLFMTYWVANIEGHDLYLENLNANQWISVFNAIIIYFSGCLIGLITLYKSKGDNNEK